MDAGTHYWVAPDGTKHALTAQQLDGLLRDESASSSQPTYSSIQQLEKTESGNPKVLHSDISGLDDLDREMLADAERADSEDDDEAEDEDDEDSSDSDESDLDRKTEFEERPTRSESENAREYASDDGAHDENFAWIPRGAPPAYTKSERLPVPVVIPQVHPGIKRPFSRAWGPILESRGVRKEDFLQFLDHLNVCKAASPPLQILQLAGEIIGFTPIPFSYAVSAGTTLLSIGGMYAVSRYRIVRYLKRVNHEYFFPRGLYATVAKQKNINQFTGQPAEEPILSPLLFSADKSAAPSLRDRRLLAMGNYVAPIEYHQGAPAQEANFLDRWSAKRTAKKARKSERRAMKKSLKPMKKQARIERKIAKSEAEGEAWKIPELELKLKEKGLEGRPGSHSKNAVKQEKQARKFLFVVVGHLDDEALRRLKSQT